MSGGGYLFIALGLIAMVFSPVIIRYAQYGGAPSLLIATGRMVVSALLLTPIALGRHLPELKRLSRGDYLLAAVAGLFLALHFATWIASLEYTSVLISVILVGTSAIWVGILEILFLRMQPHLLLVLAIVITLIGGVLIGAGNSDGAADGGSLTGAILSVSGAMTFAVYLVIGRRLRRQVSLVPQIWLVYSFAAVLLALAVAAMNIPVTGYSSDVYWWIVALALAPQLIGHSSMNYAVRYVSATYMMLLTQLEPVGSAIAAYILFAEQPTWTQVAGSLVVLAGVVLASYGQNRAEPAVEAIEEAEAESLGL